MACDGITLNLSPIASHDEPVEGKIFEGQLASAVGCDGNSNALGEYGWDGYFWRHGSAYRNKILSSLFDLCSENQRTSIQAWQDVIISYTHRPEEAENECQELTVQLAELWCKYSLQPTKVSVVRIWSLTRKEWDPKNQDRYFEYTWKDLRILIM